MQNCLNFPHLFLFVYDLGNIGSDEERKTPESWETLRQRLQVSARETVPGYYLFPDGKKAEQADGFYRPLSLGDTESLLVAYSEDATFDLERDSCFGKFRAKIGEVQGNLGKTWIIAAYRDSSSELEPEKIAAKAYRDLTGAEWQNPQKGFFMGASIWEVWQKPNRWQNLSLEFGRVLIIIFPDRETIAKMEIFYDRWIWLFYYSSKILWAYSTTPTITKSLAKEDIFPRFEAIASSKISGLDLNLSDEDLKQLKIALQKNMVTLAKQAEWLRDLTWPRQDLIVSLHNYRQRFDALKKSATELGETSLPFMEEFATIAQEKYQAQIEQDYVSLSEGLRLREKYIDTIRGIVEISQAESDRQREELEKTRQLRLERLIAAAGFGVGIGGIFASSSGYLTADEKIETPIPFSSITLQLHPFAIALVLSLVSGLLAAQLAVWRTRVWLDHLDRKDKTKQK